MTAMLTSTLLIAQLAGAAAPPAQTQTSPAAEAPMVKPDGLPTVWLTDARGVEHRGRLVRVEPAGVVLLGTDGERAFTRSDIVQIEKRGDSIRNGALIGAAIGALGGLFAIGLSDCPGLQQNGCGGARVTLALTSVAAYTAIGAGIDAAVQGRTLIYRAPSLTLSVRPSGASAGISIRW